MFCIVVLLPSCYQSTGSNQFVSDSIPNSKKSDKGESASANSSIIRGVTKPTLEIYLHEKEKATGAAVIICPGGSYAVIVYQGEGLRTAKEFQKKGIAFW